MILGNDILHYVTENHPHATYITQVLVYYDNENLCKKDTLLDTITLFLGTHQCAFELHAVTMFGFRFSKFFSIESVE